MNEPADPMTPTEERAIRLHEIFASYVAAGFTRPEALDLIIALLQQE